MSLIFFSILIILLSSSYVFSQNVINAISVNPLNRIKISFDKIPQNIVSELSQDKKTITLVLKEKFISIDTTLQYAGIINKATIKTNEESLIVKIELNDRRGYSIASIPYSNSIMVDVFQWNSLTEGEDKFRTALIALEGKFKNSAYLDLVESIKKDTKEAATILGLDLVQDGYIQSSKKLFEYSLFKGDTIIYEIYAGLSDIYNSLGNISKSNEFSAKFLSKSQLKKLDFLINQNKNPQDSIFLQTLSFLDSLMPISEIDSTKLIVQDTTNKSKIDSTTIQDEKIDSSIVEYIIYLLLAILLLIIYFYVKWRNQKLNDLIDNKKIRVPENKKESSTKKEVQNKPINKKLANIYNRKDIIEEENIPKQEIKKTEFDKITEQSEKSKTLLDIVKKVQDENKKAETKEIKVSEPETISHQRLPAKIEIAMNIAQEQKRIKEQSLEEFNTLSFPMDKEKLSEVSKKLGIEMSGFEIRKQIDKIMKSDHEMEELKNKFTNRAE